MEDRSIEGRADHVIRRLIEEGGVEEALIMVEALIEGGHDISVAFRACLIAQEHEDVAMQIGQAKLHLHGHGFMLEINPRDPDNDRWYETTPPEIKAAMDQALIWVMRGANIDAYIDDDGIISNRGQILPTSPDSVEHLVGQFKAEIDEQFPDVPPTRQGKWW